MARKAVAPALLALLIASGLHLGGGLEPSPPLCPDADLPAAQLPMDRFNDSTSA